MSNKAFNARHGISVGSTPVDVVDNTGEVLTNAASATKLKTTRTFEISGDVVAPAVNFDGTGNVNLVATIQANSVALGTDTTGNYMVDVSAGTGVSVSHTQGEGSTATVSIGQAVATTDSPTFADLTLTGQLKGPATFTIDPAGVGDNTGKVVIKGDLQIDDTTTTLNSTTVTLDDPVLTLGGDTDLTSDDTYDRGIEFRWYDTQARLGFFGFDRSTGKYTFIPQATLSSGVYSGTTGEIDAKLDWSNVLNKPTIDNTTYNILAVTSTGGALLRLNSSSSTNDDVKFASGTNTSIAYTDDNTITISSTDTNTTYNVKASTQTNGAGIDLDAGGSGSGTDTVKILGSGGTTVARTDADTITVSSTSVGDGTLSALGASAGATNTHVALEFSGAYSANTSTNRTIKPVVGPALSALATVMTGSASTGFLKKSGEDTYTLDTNTYSTTDTVTRLRGTVSGTYTSGDLTLLAGSNVTITQSGSDYTIAATQTTVNDGTLSIAAKSAGATNTDVTLELSGDYSANTADNRTIKAVVGPALTALATLMTTAGAGFIKRGASADTYTIDTSSYATTSHTHYIGTTQVQSSSADQAVTGITSITGSATPATTLTIQSTASSNNLQTSGPIVIQTGAATGSSNLSGALTLKTGDATNKGSGAISITTGASSGSNASGTITLQTGTPTGSGPSGAIQILSGNAASSGTPGGSGAVTLGSGTASYNGAASAGNSGVVTLRTGASYVGSTGNLNIYTGSSLQTGVSGSISMYAGTSNSASASGSVTIYGGTSEATGAAGNVTIRGGASTSIATSATAGNVYIIGGYTDSTAVITKTGGSVYLDGGVPATSGTRNIGQIYIGTRASATVETLQVNIGTSSNTTVVNGTVKLPNVGTSGFVKLGADGQLSADTNTYLTAEADTLSTVTGRANGNYTSSNIGSTSSTALALATTGNLGTWIGGISDGTSGWALSAASIGFKSDNTTYAAIGIGTANGILYFGRTTASGVGTMSSWLEVDSGGVANFKRARPQYNGSNLALVSDIPSLSGYLTSESDTLATVTGRGATTSSTVSFTGASKLGIQGANDGSSNYGIFLWQTTDTNWGIYMSTAGAGKSLANGAAPASIDGRTSHHVRFRAGTGATNGFIWENAQSEMTVMSLTTDTGNLYVKGSYYVGNSTSTYMTRNGTTGCLEFYV